MALLLFSTTVQAAEEPKKEFFLPKSPVAAAYVLGRLSNKELIEAPRSEFVYVALIQRKGLERKYRMEALEGLAKIRGTDLLTELIKGLIDLDKKGADAEAVLRDLHPILLQVKPEELAGKRSDLERLTREPELPLTRQIGFAALITADGKIDPAWTEAQSDPTSLANVISGLELVRNPAVRSEAYAKIEPLVDRADAAEVRRAAIMALSVMPGLEVEVFKKLALMVQEGTERAAAIASLQRIPKKAWPKELAQPTLDRLLPYLEQVSPETRSESGYVNALQFAGELASLLPSDRAKAIQRTLRGLGPTILVLRAVFEQMIYDKPLLVVEAGKPVEIILQNDDVMQHNLVIVVPGALEEIGMAAEKLAPEPDAQGRQYVPASSKVLFATRLLDAGQSTRLAFKAPDQPGDYPYVCTYPGHWRRMNGTLAVVKDVEAYLASKAAEPEPALTEWRVADLSPDLPKVAQANAAKGREHFIKLACAQCHKIGTEGIPYGPELSETVKRLKNDRAEILRHIIDPGAAIEERYRNVQFDLNDGESVTGMVLKEDAESVTIQTGPSDALIHTLKKSEIKARQPQTSSPMPVGLLNSLSKSQIMELLAYIESGGKVDPHAHPH
jgi:putative heme-binding domain-containing protein